MSKISKTFHSLTRLVFDEVSLVPSGDDPQARVLLSKADPDLDRADAVAFTAITKRGLPTLERQPGNDDNWVDRAGGLPDYIDRIARHLHYERGFEIGHAIASAVNKVEEWAAGGGNVKPDTQAKAAKALAEWEAKKVAGRVKKGAPTGTDTDEAVPTLPGDMNSQTPEDAQMSDATAAPETGGIPADVLEYIEALEDENDALREALDSAGAAPAEPVEPVADEVDEEPVVEDEAPEADVEDDEEDETEKVAKSAHADPLAEAIAKADPVVREILAKAAEEAAAAEALAAEAIAKAEQAEEEKVAREYVAKAESFNGLGQNTETVASVLRAIDGLPSEVAKAAKAMLAAASAQSETAPILEEIGKSTAEPASNSDSVAAKAAEIKKSNPDLTSDAAARAEAYRQDRALLREAMNNKES